MGASPSLPLVFACDVPGVMEVGRIISITARVSPDPARFSVDLKCANGDIAFHFNPRFDEEMPAVVCNTCSENKWGPEERTLQMPFHQGESFEMTITIKDSYYEVFVNGTYFLRYSHRLPFHTVTGLEFKGDIKFENCSPRKDPPPYSPPLQNDALPNGVCVSGEETSEQPEPAGSGKTQRTETRIDFVDVPQADQQPGGCCYCRLFFRSLRLRWTKWKIGGDVAIRINKVV